MICFYLVKSEFLNVFPWWCFHCMVHSENFLGRFERNSFMGEPVNAMTLCFFVVVFINHHYIFLANKPCFVKIFGVVLHHIWIISKLLLVEWTTSVDKPWCHSRLNRRVLQVLNKTVAWRECQAKEFELHSVYSEVIKEWSLELGKSVLKYIFVFSC